MFVFVLSGANVFKPKKIRFDASDRWDDFQNLNNFNSSEGCKHFFPFWNAQNTPFQNDKCRSQTPQCVWCQNLLQKIKGYVAEYYEALKIIQPIMLRPLHATAYIGFGRCRYCKWGNIRHNNMKKSSNFMNNIKEITSNGRNY